MEITVEQALQTSAEFEKLMAYYRCAIMEVETKFKVLNENYALKGDCNPIESIRTRLKSADSIIGKLKRKGLPLTPESIEANIHDVAGVRVICSFVSDIYILADALLSQDDVFLLKKKDYYESPKANGYRSLHLIIETPIFLGDEKKMMHVEVQLRTLSMDTWASLEHQIHYKKAAVMTPQMLDELYQCAQTCAELDSCMEKLKEQLR